MPIPPAPQINPHLSNRMLNYGDVHNRMGYYPNYIVPPIHSAYALPVGSPYTPIHSIVGNHNINFSNPLFPNRPQLPIQKKNEMEMIWLHNMDLFQERKYIKKCIIDNQTNSNPMSGKIKGVQGPSKRKKNGKESDDVTATNFPIENVFSSDQNFSTDEFLYWDYPSDKMDQNNNNNNDNNINTSFMDIGHELEENQSGDKLNLDEDRDLPESLINELFNDVCFLSFIIY